MNKLFLAVAVALCATGTATGQVKMDWQNVFNGEKALDDGIGGAGAFRLDKSGNLYIAGFTVVDSARNDANLFSAKYDTKGKQRWKWQWQNFLIRGYDNSLKAIAFDDSGNVITYGDYDGSAIRTAQRAALTFRNNPQSGKQTWEDLLYWTYSCRAGGFFIDSDDSFIYSMSAQSSTATYGSFRVVKPVPDTTIIRKRSFEFETTDYHSQVDPGPLLPSPYGDIYALTTFSAGDPDSSYFDAVLFKLTKNGRFSWKKVFNTSKAYGRQAIPAGLAVDKNGNVYLAYNARTQGNDDAIVVKCDSAGKVLWQKKLSAISTTAETYKINALALDLDGNVVVTGLYTDANFKSFAMTAKYSSASKLMWYKIRKCEDKDYEGTLLKTDKWNNIIVAGTASNTDVVDPFLMKYNARGDELWMDSLHLNKQNITAGMDMDTFGNVFLGANTIDTVYTQQDILLAKYKQELHAAFKYETECKGVVYFENYSSTGRGYMTYKWDFGDGQTDPSENPAHQYQPGTYVVKLQATDVDGSKSTFSDTIVIKKAPKADFTATKLNSKTYHFAARDTTMYAYYWDFGDGKTDSGSISLNHRFLLDGTYTVRLIVVNAEGCRDTVIQQNVVVITGIAERAGEQAGNGISLSPVPFSKETNLSYRLESGGDISIIATDVLGRDVILYRNTYQPAGEYTLNLNNLEKLNPGILLFRLFSDGECKASVKALMVK